MPRGMASQAIPMTRRIVLATGFLLSLLSVSVVRPAAACFTPGPANVPENTPIGTLIAPFITASPAGYSPIISFADKATTDDYACYFSVNRTGVYISRLVDLEFPASCQAGANITDMKLVRLTVQCDSITIGTLFVAFLAVDEFSPYFLQPLYNYSISESVPVSSLVAILKDQVDDKDVNEDRNFKFAIVSTVSGAPDYFTMEEDGATAGRVRVKKALDYDAGPSHRQYVLNISATPLSATPNRIAFTLVQVNIIDFDDLNPRFTQDTYRLSFMENETSIINQSLHTVPKIEAFDMDFGINQTVNYKIQSGISNRQAGYAHSPGNSDRDGAR